MKALGIIVVLLPFAATAATITVNTTADNTTGGDGFCTLREAITNVNAAADTTNGDCVAGTGAGDTIAFSLRPPATIRLLLGEISIARDVTIAGPVSGSLRIGIDGQGAPPLLHVTAGNVQLSNLRIQNGSPFHNLPLAPDDSGEITVDNGASVTMIDCVLRHNVGVAVKAGAIANLTACIMTQDQWSIQSRGAVDVANCTFDHNGARIGRPVIYTFPGASLSVRNCTFRQNSGTDISSGGTAIVNDCTFSGGHALLPSIVGDGPTDLNNCTITNKAIGGNGLTLTNCTLLGDNIYSNQMDVRNTVLVNGFCVKPLTSNGHNLTNNNTCIAGGGTDLVNTDPLFARLGNYGGPTQTIALCTAPGVPKASCRGVSPAIDAGDDSVTGPPDNLSTDQRGFPRLSGAHVDIGAFEVQQ